MRLFVALDVPEETHDALASLIHQFSEVCRGARWVRAEGVHVTLKFIGETEEARLSEIKGKLAEVSSAGAIEFAFRQFGFFPNERRPRVFWVGMKADESLAELAGQIDAKLQSLGIPHEEKDFRPHLTLARFNSLEGLPKLREMIQGHATRELGRTTAREFHLYQSVLKRSGAEYTRLASFAFARGTE
ncbi:MAG TPA: RNA 2',3'-cyclic phosphodiesterase [Candidatus Acidoferrales bacterium]|nr:RNA 2',3'-cyclic phosphodiesterase [Candidatus Acidoferrales bacterium]